MSHPLVERLHAPDPAERRAACAAIPADPSAVLLLEPLRDILSDPDPGVRRAASDALVAVGRQESAVDALLLGALRGDDPAARFEAAHALAELAPPSPKLIPALIEALGSERRETAWEAARILVDAGRMHAEVTPIALGLVRAGPSSGARCMAVACVRELAPEHPETAAALLEAAADADAALRRAAFTALPSLAPYLASPDGARELEFCCEAASRSDEDPGVRRLAARALDLIRNQAPAASDGLGSD